MPAFFEVYKDKKGGFRFRLKAPNGEILASSEGYSTKQSCINGIDSVKIHAATAQVIELNPDRDLLDACDRGDLQAAKKALRQGANPNALDREGETALLEAVESGNLPLVQLLVRSRANIHQADYHGETPLHEAAEEGHEQIVGFLIKQGAKIDARDNTGNTPLHKALLKGKWRASQVLARAGAKTNLVNNDGKTPRKIAEERDFELAAQAAPVKKIPGKKLKKPGTTAKKKR